MTEKSLDQKIREARSSQEIADLQAQQSGAIRHVEGFSVPAAPVANGPWSTPVETGRVRVYSERDGHVDLSVDQLVNALKIDPTLKVTAMGSNAELQKRIDECRDTSELTQLMAQARQGKI